MLRVVGQVGRFSKGDMLKDMIICLLSSLGQNDEILRATAHDELRALAKGHQTSVDNMFGEFRKGISIMLVDNIGSTPLLESVSGLLDMSDCAEFLRNSLSYVLPHLISTKKAVNLVQLAQTLQQEVTTLLSSEKIIVDILIELVVSELGSNKDELLGVLTFWNSQVNGNRDADFIHKVVKKSARTVLCSLILKLGGSMTIKWKPLDKPGDLPPVVGLSCTPIQVLMNLGGEQYNGIESFLEGYLLGVIYYLNAFIFKKGLKSGSRDRREQRRGLQGLILRAFLFPFA